ncbi:hypothetical protein acsn021_29130 [Anaerocolumna cellulosilytica]|uniref:UPF0291 protein acsn021_29130 n=1 Tax=Anaerocolumna cellulosilytica TaxID=433286 RepID=A0A6S6QXG6_9FIRM|nr:DUF896 domain-containing protein [Anaerocolumna cellulosilytica]MBB5197131.1 uncharacterized protein YnzC (UPF0291/DUF896 family) [Anaerocolumna cellulosilytica]BCJ95344.1 hypothetical protein acsn021_29130 [Anaerocolumna cellulosilytica]
MEESRLARINELYKKSKEIGLTEAEKTEQAELRSEYIQAIRKNLRGTLNQISLLNPDGSVTELSKKEKH